MTLSWDPVLSDRFCSVEEFEEVRGAPTPAKRVSAKTRETWLQNNGHSRESIIRATNEIVEIKHQRRETVEHDRPLKVDHVSTVPPRQPLRTEGSDRVLEESSD